jgi:hypothetical protein
MKRVLALIISLILCVIAVLFASKNSISDKINIKYHGYNVVVKAEKELEKGHYQNALYFFRTAISRAAINGERQIIKKIRNRIAAVGIENIRSNNDDIWRFFEYYALTSNDFQKSASSIEMLYFKNGFNKSRFDYYLIRKTEKYTCWETNFEKYSYTLRKLASRFLDESSRERMKNELAVFIDNLHLQRLPLRVECPNGISECSLIVDGIENGEDCFILGSMGYAKLTTDYGKKVYIIKTQKRNLNIIEFIIQSKKIRSKEECDVYICREYQSI